MVACASEKRWVSMKGVAVFDLVLVAEAKRYLMVDQWEVVVEEDFQQVVVEE